MVAHKHPIVMLSPLSKTDEGTRWIVKFSCDIRGIVLLTGKDERDELTADTVKNYPSGREMLADAALLCATPPKVDK